MTLYEYRKNEIDENVRKATECKDVETRNALLYVAEVEQDWLDNITLAQAMEIL